MDESVQRYLGRSQEIVLLKTIANSSLDGVEKSIHFIPNSGMLLIFWMQLNQST